MPRYHNINGVKVQFTAEEETARDAEEKAWSDNKLNRDLSELRNRRNTLLAETDFYALSDVTMSDAVKTWRQTLRDLPQNNTTEAKYDELLARDSDGNLTHNVWTMPS